MNRESPMVNILLIEDDEEDYLILRDCLMEDNSPTKFNLDWAKTYQDGLAKIEHAEHDVYLIDHYLEEKSGLELLKEAIQAGCQAPMIIVTGRSDREIDQAALMAGAMDYLVKGKMDGQLLERSIRYALERNRLLKKIRELALRDSLTGLYNRREFDRFLNYEIIKSKRYNHQLSMMMMDIDHFKEINDRLGHRSGDVILERIGQLLLKNTRGCDLPARYGGDEFIIVLPETSAEQAYYSAERLRKKIEALSIQVTSEYGLPEALKITASFGIADFPGNADGVDALIDMSDRALYQAKRQGCNKVVAINKVDELERGVR